MSVEPEQVEGDEGDGDLLGHPLDLPFVLEVHPLLEEFEGRPTSVLHRHDLPVEHCVHLVHELVDHVDVGVLERDVTTPAGPEDRAARLHLGEGADAVELRLEAPSRVVEGLAAALGEHRLEPRRCRDPWSLLGGGQEREPIGPRLDEVELQPRVATAVETEAHLRVRPLDRLVPPVVEDPDLAGAVVPLGDRPFERSVLERMHLGLDGESLVALGGWEAAGHGPRGEAAVAFEPDVVVEPGRAMLVDHEGVAGPGHLAGCGLGGAGLAEVAPPHVLVQVRVLRLLHDLLGGLPDDGRSRGLRERRRELGDVVLGSHVERVERGRQIHRLRAHAREEVSSLGEPVPDVVDPEVLGLEAALEHLLPRERGRDGRAGLGAQRVRSGDVGALSVHVVVDEDLPGAVGDLPRHRYAVGVGLRDRPTAGAHERPHLPVGVGPSLHGQVDPESGGSRGLRIRGQPQLIEDDLDVAGDGQDVLVRVRLERVEVEEQVVGVRDVLAAGVQRMHLDAAEVRDVEQRRGVVDHQVVDPAALRVVRVDLHSDAPSPACGRAVFS